MELYSEQNIIILQDNNGVLYLGSESNNLFLKTVVYSKVADIMSVTLFGLKHHKTSMFYHRFRMCYFQFSKGWET